MDQQNGRLTHYRIIIMETQILHLDDGRVILNTEMYSNSTHDSVENLHQLIEMLHPGYNYTITIAAATSAGLGVYSTAITVMTLEDGKFVACTCVFGFSL